MSATIHCRRCGSLTEAGLFCQICGAPLAEQVSNESTQLRAQVDNLTRQIARMEGERRDALRQREDLQNQLDQTKRQRDDLQHLLDQAKSDVATEARRRERAEGEAERLKTALASAEKSSRKTLDEITAEVYEYLASHRGEIDTLRCAAELHVSETEVMESIDFLQRQRKIDRV